MKELNNKLVVKSRRVFAPVLFVFAASAIASTDVGSAHFDALLASQVESALGIEQQADGSFEINNPVQAVQAQVRASGTRFVSTATEKNQGGHFGLQLMSWGREDNLQVLESAQIYRQGDAVFHAHISVGPQQGIVEKFSNSGNGIRQDFIVPARPQGHGALQVQLGVDGATLRSKDDGFAVALAHSQRTLTYDRLQVSDANGRRLPAHMQLLAGNRINIVVDDRSAAYPLTIDPTVGDINWLPGISGSSTTNHVIQAVVRKGANIYVAGLFTSIEGVSANRIARWNGTSWSAMGTGMNDDVYALAVDGGNVYAGGAFTTAGGVTVNHIAKWNGSSWSALGSGLDNTVFSLLIDANSNVYVGGGFTSAGGLSVNRIAKWNGAWSALGTGMATAGSSVNALAFNSSGHLYAAGSFTTAGGVSASRVALWNGAAWSAVGTGVNNTVFALAYAGGNLYAGGMFTMAGSATRSYIARWSGTSWAALGSGMNNEVYTLAVDNNDNIYAGGAFTTAGGNAAKRIALWDGSAWSAFGNGLNGGVYGLVLDNSGDLVVGGTFTTAGGKVATYLARWLLVDTDGDEVGDDADNCPDASNPNQANADGDAQGNACDNDDDNDGVPDSADAYPLISLDGRTDTDGDGRPNNCNTACQATGMAADDDDDNDTVLDVNDAFPLDATESLDTDSDGTGNNADTDDDNDTVLDVNDAFPLDAAESLDTDSDGTGNNADTDDDNDLMPDIWENQYGLNPLVNDASGDPDSDGFTNGQEYTNGTDPTVANTVSVSVKNDYNHDGIAGWIWKGESNGVETQSQNWQLTFPLYSPNWAVPNRFYTPIFPDQTNWELLTSGDFNKDGDADILWRHKTLATWKVWQMQDGLRVAQNSPADFDLAHEWTVVGAGDTDRDGDDDVILNKSSTGEILIWQMQDHAIAATQNIGTKAGYTLSRIGDFNKDADVDLLLRQNSADVLVTWEIQANAFVAERALASTGTGYNPVCAGDFDNDGDDDIMLVNSSTTQEKWFVMENYVRTQSVGATNTGFVFKGCGDYDGDGDADMFWQRSSDDANRVILQQNYGATKQTVYTNVFGGVNPGAAGYGFVYRGNSN
jgi:hypothetical protein